jgi:hypothetical protein
MQQQEIQQACSFNEHVCVLTRDLGPPECNALLHRASQAFPKEPAKLFPVAPSSSVLSNCTFILNVSTWRCFEANLKGPPDRRENLPDRSPIAPDRSFL